METPAPTGAVSAALNIKAKPVQRPPVNPQPDSRQQVNSRNDVAETLRVKPDSRVVNFIGTTA